MPKTKKLKNLHVAHGMTETPEDRNRKVRQIMGSDRSSKYAFLSNPLSTNEYEEYLNKLNNSELFAHCQNFGYLYTDNRKQVITNLIREFETARAHTLSASYQEISNPNVDVEKVKKIMSRK